MERLQLTQNRFNTSRSTFEKLRLKLIYELEELGTEHQQLLLTDSLVQTIPMLLDQGYRCTGIHSSCMSGRHVIQDEEGTDQIQITCIMFKKDNTTYHVSYIHLDIKSLLTVLEEVLELYSDYQRHLRATQMTDIWWKIEANAT